MLESWWAYVFICGGCRLKRAIDVKNVEALSGGKRCVGVPGTRSYLRADTMRYLSRTATLMSVFSRMASSSLALSSSTTT